MRDIDLILKASALRPVAIAAAALFVLVSAKNSKKVAQWLACHSAGLEGYKVTVLANRQAIEFAEAQMAKHRQMQTIAQNAGIRLTEPVGGIQ